MRHAAAFSNFAELGQQLDFKTFLLAREETLHAST